ncbi:MAG: hypothetical protein MJ149_02065, partial [Clostridia bacterium]|nr:hypothetical protein [Clostridia bacterium]
DVLQLFQTVRDVNNALAFKQYKKEHKALAKEVKKLAKSKKPEDVAKHDELEAKLKNMETNYTASTMSPADPRADEYNQYLQNQQKFLLYVAGLDPNSEEAKIAEKCKFDDKKMAITYKGVDINAEIGEKTKPEVKTVVENLKTAVAEKEPHKPEIVGTDVIKNEVFTPKNSEEAENLKVDTKTGKVAKKEVEAEATTGIEHGV